jgi:[ribosomal protein S18]-alanine N-acetyltransferase
MALADGYTVERITGGADLDAVVALEADSFTNPWTKEMLVRELETSLVARVYVLRAPGGRVAAFCSCWILYDELHINTLAVDAACRRRGLATMLMTHLLTLAASEGATRALLEVRQSNIPAIRLYETLGFEITRIRRGYYTQPDEDALVLTRGRLPDTPEKTAKAGA